MAKRRQWPRHGAAAMLRLTKKFRGYIARKNVLYILRYRDCDARDRERRATGAGKQSRDRLYKKPVLTPPPLGFRIATGPCGESASREFFPHHSCVFCFCVLGGQCLTLSFFCCSPASAFQHPPNIHSSLAVHFHVCKYIVLLWQTQIFIEFSFKKTQFYKLLVQES